MQKIINDFIKKDSITIDNKNGQKEKKKKTY